MRMLIIWGILTGFQGVIFKALKFALKEHDLVLSYLAMLALVMSISLSLGLLGIMWISH